MNRHYYDRPLLCRDFRRERSDFEKVLGTIGTVAHTVGAVAHTVGVVKHTVDVVKGKVHRGFHNFRSWTALPSLRVSALDSWRRHSFDSFAHRLSERMHSRVPSLAMAIRRGDFGR